MKLIIAVAAVVLTVSAAQAQQQNICASWACNGCVYQNIQALGRAGDPRVLRPVREKQLRGGGPVATNTRDFQSVLRSNSRACGCPMRAAVPCSAADLGECGPSRLVATAAADCLSKSARRSQL